MIIPMIFLKIILSVLFGFLTVRLYYVAKYGRATRRSHGKGPSLDFHRYSVRRASFNLLFVVLGVEAIVYLNGGNRDDSLRHPHFYFVGAFVALFITQVILGIWIWIKGEESPSLVRRWHHRIGYACFGAYAPMLATGLIMLWRM